MKKWLKITLISVSGLIAAIVLFLGIVFVVNIVSTKSEREKIHQYGQLVPVDGKNMNVLIQGDGEETIVLLPGYGTASPVLDFKPIIDELSPNYRVVAIEPFGYGLSDETDKERTTENIVNEIHEALQQLKIDRFILMGHSITGIYGINYVSKYPNEVIAFAGIDTSVPNQPGMDKKFPTGLFSLLKKSGIARLVLNFGDGPYDYAGLAYDDETKEQLRMIQLKTLYNSTVLNEMNHIASNFKGAQGLTFPKDLPIILFVQGDNTANPQWVPLHEEQIKDSIQKNLIVLNGQHYLHHTHSKTIAENFNKFMEEVK